MGSRRHRLVRFAVHTALGCVAGGGIGFAGGFAAVCGGGNDGVFRTESALSAQWPLNGASESVLTVEVADMPRGDGRRVQFAAKAWTEDGRQFDLLLSD